MSSRARGRTRVRGRRGRGGAGRGRGGSNSSAGSGKASSAALVASQSGEMEVKPPPVLWPPHPCEIKPLKLDSQSEKEAKISKRIDSQYSSIEFYMDHGNLIGKRSKNDKLQDRLIEDCQTWITPKEILLEIPESLKKAKLEYSDDEEMIDTGDIDPNLNMMDMASIPLSSDPALLFPKDDLSTFNTVSLGNDEIEEEDDDVEKDDEENGEDEDEGYDILFDQEDGRGSEDEGSDGEDTW